MPLPRVDDFGGWGFDPLTGGAWDVVFIDIPAILAEHPDATGIYLGDSPLWIGSAEPAPAPPEPIPPLTPQPPAPPGPLPDPINDPVIEPRTPITPQPLPPVGEPTLPPQPILPSSPSTPTPPSVDAPPPIEIPPVVGIGLGEIIVGIGGLLYPTDTAAPEIDSGFGVPTVDIPPPAVLFPDLPDFGAPPLADQPFPYPQAPDVIVVTAPQPQPAPRSQTTPWPITNTGSFPWPILRPTPRKRTQPLPRSLAPPQPTTPPLPSSPTVTPPLPTSPPLPLTPPTVQPSLPPSVPSAPPAPLTGPQTASVESAPDGQTCETPQQTKERRERKRENCRKLVKIHVKAHWKRVCVSDAIEHEAKRYRKKLVRKYITKPAGKLGTAAADWLLNETGLTPYAEQAKDVKKRVSDLTKKQKRYYYEVPGTHVKIDPVDWIPKGKP